MDADGILAIDQGTTNTKALIVDRSGAVIAGASRSLAQSHPQPAWVEQDPLAIWRSVQEAIDGCLAQAGPRPLAAIAVTNQRETALAWERRTGQPLGPAIGWQCQRTAAFCEQLRAQGLEPLVRERTGLTMGPMFSGSKMRWLLDHIPEGRQRAAGGDICLGTMDSWVLWNLTAGAVHACDLTNASRTQLLNLRSLAWDEELLEIFGVPRPALPEIRPSGGPYGECVPAGRLAGGVPIVSLIGDSHAALYGHARLAPGAVKATYGTGSSLMAPTSAIVTSTRGMTSTIAWSQGGAVTYALEGNIYATGAAVQWLGEALGLGDPGPEVETLAGQVPDTGGVYLVPAFAGLGAPYWNAAARGLFCGLTLGTTRAHLARAALEAIAFQVCDVFDAMEADAGAHLAVLLADGGASRNDLLMQCQADILGRPVERSASAELSALGAAYLAGLATGVWSSPQEIAQIAPPHERFEPQMPPERRAELYAGWRGAVAQALLAR